MSTLPGKRRGPLLWLAGLSLRRIGMGLALLPVLYVVSFGPACWLTSRTRRDYSEGSLHPLVMSPGLTEIHGPLIARGPDSYGPLLYAARRSTLVGKALLWYGRLGADAETTPVFFDHEIQWAGPMTLIFGGKATAKARRSWPWIVASFVGVSLLGVLIGRRIIRHQSAKRAP